MRIASWMTAAAIAATLTGCYTYPVYQPMPIARLTPAQSAALAQQQQPLTQADRDRLARDNAQVATDDRANSYAQATSPYAYAYPAAPVYDAYPYYATPYPYYYGGGPLSLLPGSVSLLRFPGQLRGLLWRPLRRWVSPSLSDKADFASAFFSSFPVGAQTGGTSTCSPSQ